MVTWLNLIIAALVVMCCGINVWLARDIRRSVKRNAETARFFAETKKEYMELVAEMTQVTTANHENMERLARLASPWPVDRQQN